MKKLAILLSFILVLCLCGCDKPSPYFEATVIQNRGTMLLVAPNEDEKLYSIADSIYHAPRRNGYIGFQNGGQSQNRLHGRRC